MIADGNTESQKEARVQKALAGREAFEADLMSATEKEHIVDAVHRYAIGGQIWLQSSVDVDGRFENADHVASMIQAGVAEVGDWAVREAVVRIRARGGRWRSDH